MVVKRPSAGGQWSQLFPTKCSLFVFLAYMALFINQGIMVTASQRADNSYSYNTVTVVLLSEATKLVVSFLLYLRENSASALFAEMSQHMKVLALYMVPALLYCLYNNLAFVNLAAYDPTTYFLLLQLRVVITGIVFQVLFKKQLSKWQWVSLFILTLGCIVKQLNVTEKNAQAVTSSKADDITSHVVNSLVSVHTGLVLLQVLCSCLAGVYNEKLLKDIGAEVHIMVQNVFMYIDSILCNAAVLLMRGELGSAFTFTALSQIWQPAVIVIIINNAAVGIVTSFFLRNLNSILKTFASALELMFTAVLSWLIFGIPIGWWTALAIALVTYASWMYAQNPVINRGRLDQLDSNQTSEEVKLVPSEMTEV
ncbi:UDP-galactose transporter senju-like isoform X2 [Penaeus japonicus]|uniref:UDP-galactose transporter senju-like isoform X1 n=1 Tax=Penaeus japonicus TaxID=27405 RepID=UPI001C715346|nr:UDP-galactose transporter senju-like isoform X1 [Penaeus japonicus]XP_042862362.1 UDP-galactose transporter senju-like isoform X2 [Penaeus japonicus]